MSPQVNGTYFKIMRYLLPTKIAAVLLATTSLAELVHDFAENGDLASVQAELGKGVDLKAQDCDEKLLCIVQYMKFTRKPMSS